MNSGKYTIPKYLDEPFRIIIFTVDEFIITFSATILMWIIVNEIAGMVAGLGAYYYYTRFKRREASAYLKRTLFWMYNLGFHRCIPSSSIRKLKG